MKPEIIETKKFDYKAYSKRMAEISKAASRHAREAERAAAKASLTH